MNSYEIALEWAKERGLKILPTIQRKTTNRVAGLYATEQINKGTLLASIPVSSLIQPEDNFYPPNTSTAAKYIHSTSTEITRGLKSNFQPIFGLFDPKEYLSQNSVQYFSQEELALLETASPALAQQVNHFIHSNKALIDALKSFDPSIDLDTYEYVSLNYASRAMTDKGFVPILDCFNHNDAAGSGIEKKDELLLLTARKTYLTGEQIFVTYGVLDIFQHAINYNYYDPTGTHYIPIKRFRFPRIPQSTVQSIQAVDANTRVLQSGPVASIHNPNAHLSLNGPSHKLLEILKNLANDEYHLKASLLNLLDHLDHQNNIQQLSKQKFKGRLKRFYNALSKEKEIIASNRIWLKNNL